MCTCSILMCLLHFGVLHNLIPPPICSQRRGGNVHSSSLLLLFLFVCSLSLSSLPLSSTNSSSSSPLFPPPPLPLACLSSSPPFIFRYRQNEAWLQLKTQQVCGVYNRTPVCACIKCALMSSACELYSCEVTLCLSVAIVCVFVCIEDIMFPQGSSGPFPLSAVEN